MARSEARLSVSIWDDADFLALSPSAQRMFMFLLSQRDLAHDGVIALRVRRWSKSARGLTVEQILRDLQELSTARFTVVDEDAEELLVRSFIRRDEVYRQPNILRSAGKHLATVNSRAILEAVAAELRRVSMADNVPKGSVDVLAELLDALPEPVANPSPNPSNTPSAEGDMKARGEGGVVTAVTTDAPSSLLLDPLSPIPDAAARRPPRAGARGNRIPDDFAVTPEMVAWARERRPDIDGRLQTELFINYWRAKTGKEATKLDWELTWKNWILRAEPRAGPAPRTAFTGANRHTSQRHDNPFTEQAP